MKRTAAITAIGIALLATTPTIAADITTSEGQPLCDTADHLHEFLLASLQKNSRWMKELSTSCVSLKEGLSVGVIEEMSGENDLKVLKVRAFGSKTGSMTGYTLNVGLKGYK